MTQVTYHHISNDEAKAGDYATCQKCGAILKNFAKIGGEVFGLDCAATILGLKESRVKASWEHSLRQARIDARHTLITSINKRLDN